MHVFKDGDKWKFEKIVDVEAISVGVLVRIVLEV